MAFLKDGILVNLVGKIPGVVTVAAEGAIATSTILAILRIWPAIGIPVPHVEGIPDGAAEDRDGLGDDRRASPPSGSGCGSSSC